MLLSKVVLDHVERLGVLKELVAKADEVSFKLSPLSLETEPDGLQILSFVEMEVGLDNTCLFHVFEVDLALEDLLYSLAALNLSKGIELGLELVHVRYSD